MAGTGWDPAGVDTEVTISPDGQTATRSGDSTYSAVRGLAGRSRGRRYFEITPGAATFASYCAAGFMNADASLTQELGVGTPIAGGWKPEQGVFKYSYVSGAGMREDQDTVSAGVLGVLIDFDTKVCTIYRNGAVAWVEVMDIPDDTILYPASSMYMNASVALQTVEPFQYPPEVTFMAWDIPDSTLISRVAGLMKIEGEPVRRTLKAFSYDRNTFALDDAMITESKPLGQTVSDPVTGEYEIILRDGFPRPVLVVAFDDYGEPFQGGLSVEPGYRIHPSVKSGLVYECTGAGVLPESEPVWSTNTETSELVGTASFIAVPFYRPEAHGPLMPNKGVGAWEPVPDEYALWFQQNPKPLSEDGLVKIWESKDTPHAAINTSINNRPGIIRDAATGRALLNFELFQSLDLIPFCRDVIPGSGRIVFIVVANAISGSAYGPIVEFTATTTLSTCSLYFNGSNFEMGYRRLGGDAYRSVTRPSKTGLALIIGDFNPATGEARLSASGGEASGTYATTGNLAATESLFIIGSRASGGNSQIKMEFGEFLTLKNPTDETVLKAGGYMAHKWGLQTDLPPSHPYKTTPPKY